ncbi:uncharacterized protein EI90DRAFT_410873 [Cantharellus anzutake]|uniref:uncharacterized protein n=1 Tax=Cantharellus anzutake TaxID=1750568 RepID=UPI00190717F7|nr:uncharacterized protein EI90DRAFT_410873 [Cantharellus anzutake]KAF8314849.1 hypothetical protein EI90DRAFT_410873 [Cantharellus anzutake]
MGNWDHEIHHPTSTAAGTATNPFLHSNRHVWAPIVQTTEFESKPGSSTRNMPLVVSGDMVNTHIQAGMSDALMNRRIIRGYMDPRASHALSKSPNTDGYHTDRGQSLVRDQELCATPHAERRFLGNYSMLPRHRWPRDLVTDRDYVAYFLLYVWRRRRQGKVICCMRDNDLKRKQAFLIALMR